MTRQPASDEALPQPPSAHRVARRALVLATIACRGILENDKADPGASEFWKRVSAWWNTLGIDGELEDEEAKLLRAPFGSVDRQIAVNAGWRSESLAVLAWALGRSELPDHDVEADPAAVATCLGFLEPDTVLERPTLRNTEELERYREVAFTLHWRLREYSLNPNAMDFRSFCRTAWFGPLSLDGVALHDDDLRVGDVSISAAPAGAVRHASSIAQERHLAINWVLDASLPFSESDTST